MHACLGAQAAQPDAAPGRELLRTLIEIDTTHSTGDTRQAATAVAARLFAGGFPRDDVQIVGGAPTRENLIVRYRAASARRPPVLFLAHLDVVEAKRDDWSVDPFKLVERDGYFYGRGTLDVKGGAATLAAAFLRLRGEAFAPDRDLILALTADEEGGPDNGVRWLLEHRRDLIEAAYCVNVDSGGPELRNGAVTSVGVQASEKVYASFTLTVTNAGGHSSLPARDNAIYRLAAGLNRLAAFQFEARTNAVTREYFEKAAARATGQESADLLAVAKQPPDAGAVSRLTSASPYYNALLRTTCVPTLLQGGHAENALPQTAKATLNCRLLPDEDINGVKPTIERVLADDQIVVTSVWPGMASPPSPLAPEVFQAIESSARGIWGAIPIVPMMETGATDGALLRNAGTPVYGVTGIAYDPDDVRAHGKDERILVRSFDEGLEFSYRLIKALARR